MADLNQGTRQRNLRHVSGSAAVPSGNTRSVSAGGPPAPSTDWIQALGGRIGGWCIENGKLTADGGNVKLNSFVPSISLGAATDYITGTGFWVGKNSAVYKLHLGDPTANHLKWDGSTLTVVGTISATAGAIGGWTIGDNSISADGGAAVIDSSVPKITLGAASDYLTGAGFFVGKSEGGYKWHIGDPAGDYIGWSGSTLVAGGNWITGSAVNFLNIPVLNGAMWTNNSPSAGYVAWNSFTLTYQGTSYTIAAGNTNHKYIWWNKATSTTVLQHSNTLPDGAIDQFLVCLNSSGTALPALFQNVIYADYIKATQLSAITADLGSITAGTITGGTIRTAASGARVQMDATDFAVYDGSNVKNLIIDVNGISFAERDHVINLTALKWMAGSTVWKKIDGYHDTFKQYLDITADAITNYDSQVSIASAAPATKSGVLRLSSYNGTTLGARLLLASNDVSYGSGITIEVGGLNVGNVSNAVTGNVRYGGNLEAGRNGAYYTGYIFVPLTTPLVSTSWDGDAYSTTSKTIVDLSAVFNAPAGIKAILCELAIRDSGSAGAQCYFILSPSASSNMGPLIGVASRNANDEWNWFNGVVPCTAGGDVYYQILASGVGTFDVYWRIWGYWI